MLTIRLARIGKKNHATYRVVLMEHQKAAKGKFIEDLGFYDPHLVKNQFQIDTKRAEYWLKEGAKTSTTVASYLRKAKLSKGVKIDVINRKTAKLKKKEAEKKEEVSGGKQDLENKNKAVAGDQEEKKEIKAEQKAKESNEEKASTEKKEKEEEKK